MKRHFIERAIKTKSVNSGSKLHFTAHLNDSLFFFFKKGGYLPSDILIKFGCLFVCWL